MNDLFDLKLILSVAVGVAFAPVVAIVLYGAFAVLVALALA